MLLQVRRSAQVFATSGPSDPHRYKTPSPAAAAAATATPGSAAPTEAQAEEPAEAEAEELTEAEEREKWKMIGWIAAANKLLKKLRASCDRFRLTPATVRAGRALDHARSLALVPTCSPLIAV